MGWVGFWDFMIDKFFRRKSGDVMKRSFFCLNVFVGIFGGLFGVFSGIQESGQMD